MSLSSVMTRVNDSDYGTKTVLFIAAHVFITSLYILTKKYFSKAMNLPMVGDPNAPDFRQAMEDGARMYPNSPYILPAPTGRLVILPSSAIDEVRLLPDTVLSSKEHHYRHFLGRWTSMGTTAHELHAALTIDLQRNAAKVVEAARSEVTYSFQRNLLACHDWTAVPVFPTFLKVSALLIERTWVGLPLSREEAWIKATTSYMTDVAKAAGAIRPWSKLLRPFVAPFLSEVQSLKKNRDDVTEMMKPLIHAQFGSRQQQKPNIAGGELFTWIIQRYKGKVTPERIARDELMATFSSLYTVTATLTQTLFDLATHPEYLNPLREELATILAEDAELMQKQSLLKLKKMDSFVKESQRMNPLGLTTMMRVVMDPKGLTLSTGDYIPYGQTVAGPNHAINFSETTYKDPHKFDGFRFSRLREVPGNENKYQFVSTAADSINFGHGVNSCPGRFFASIELKVMLSHLIQNYDIKLNNGGSRPANMYTGTVCLPDMAASILFKAR